MSKLKILAILALAALVSMPAFAETQNVKVSGSLDAYWFYRSGYDLAKDHGASLEGYTATSSKTNRTNADDYFMSQTQVEVSADLTDNVSTVINLVNERDWNGQSGNTNQFDIGLDLAYVQMKEIFYSPLTLKIGRQDIWLGRGFIIGNNNTAWDSQGTISADEYSVQTAFDAVRATLDFNPWTIDMLYSKINENNINNEDDHDLYAVNVGYKFAEYNAVAEGYFVVDHDRTNLETVIDPDTGSPVSPAPYVIPGKRANETDTIGGRVQFDPISQITLGGEAAYQFGHYESMDTVKKNRDAWALDIFGTYRWDLTWKPDVTVEYVVFSGEGDLQDTNSSYGSWNKLYRGRFYTAYEDFRGWVYGTAQEGDTEAGQNTQMIQVKGNIKPLDDLLLTGSYSYFWSPESDYTHWWDHSASSPTLNDGIGQEFDFQVTYDYTEDVSFGLLTAWFFPGDKFTSPNDKVATDVVASTKVTF
ncbi:MAG: alginate export family protein [Candidatus Omnitrophota bacterium]